MVFATPFPMFPFNYPVSTGRRHCLSLTLENDPREETRHCWTSGRWFIRRSTTRGSYCSYITSLQFPLLFSVLVDEEQAAPPNIGHTCSREWYERRSNPETAKAMLLYHSESKYSSVMTPALWRMKYVTIFAYFTWLTCRILSVNYLIW